jgi:hypothetical protein
MVLCEWVKSIPGRSNVILTCIVSATLAGVLTLHIGFAAAGNHYVDKNAPFPLYPYDSPEHASLMIQPAVDAAHDFGGGDVRILDLETYFENISLWSNVWIHGSGDSCQAMPKIKPYMPGVPILTADGINDAGITQCWLLEGQAPDGAAIFVRNSNNMDVVQCCVSECSATNRGGGVYYENSEGTISNSDVFFNDAQKGAGIACDMGATPTIDTNDICENTASQAGGGIWCRGNGTDPTISPDNEIHHNSARHGGGIACQSSCAPLIDSNTIEWNSADRSGGGIYVKSANPDIRSNDLRSNNADDDDDGTGDGGGLWAEFPQLVVLQAGGVISNTFFHNWAPNGGAIWVAGFSNILDNDFTENLATGGMGGGIGMGGAVFATSAGFGGAIQIGGNAIGGEGNTFYDNGAVTAGGGIAVCPGGGGDLPFSVAIQGNTIGAPDHGNSAGAGSMPGDRGGGIYIHGDPDSTTVNVLIGGENDMGSLCEWSGVRTYQYGNVIQTNGYEIGPLCTEGIFVGPVLEGGGIAVWDRNGANWVTIEGNLIGGDVFGEGNAAIGNAAAGGGIWCESWSPVEIGVPEYQAGLDTKNCIQANRAEGMGAAGGGIALANFNTNTWVQYNIIGGDDDGEGNTADGFGGGILIANCDCWIGGPADNDGNKIKKNAAFLNSGGGIYCTGTGALIQGNDIIANRADGTAAADGGGGIACFASGDASIWGNLISSNQANGSGGGILCVSSNPIIGGTLAGYLNTISANWAAYSGGGIACRSQASPDIVCNTIEINEAFFSGGGIYCYLMSNPAIESNLISSNVAGTSAGQAQGFGGGIAAELLSSPVVTANVIAKCFADSVGGGMAFVMSSGPVVTNNTIYHNDAVITGGATYWDSSSSPWILRNIFRQYGCFDSYAIAAGGVPARFDTNDVYNDVGGLYDLDRGVDPGGSGNIFENPRFCGEDSLNLTLADNSPCLLPGGVIGAYPAGGCGNRQRQTIWVPDTYGTIQLGINAASYGDIVRVRAGKYTENVIMKSGIILVGELAPDMGPDSTVIDGGGSGVVVDCSGVDNRTIVRGFTITNGDTGVKCVNADPYIVLNLVTENLGDGIYIAGQPMTWIEHNTIVANQGDGVEIVESAPVLSHNIVSSNAGSGIFGDLAGGLITWIPNLRGNDVWSNTGGNYGGDMMDQTGVNGNISQDPEFVDGLPPDPDYRLQATSPCTEANSPTGVVMGGFPGGVISGVSGDVPSGGGPKDQPDGHLPSTFGLSGSIPNPFRDVTSLRYELPREAYVTLKIYSVRGELIRTLVSGRAEPGYYSAEWDGTDHGGRRVASGVYFLGFTAGPYSSTTKVMLLR